MAIYVDADYYLPWKWKDEALSTMFQSEASWIWNICPLQNYYLVLEIRWYKKQHYYNDFNERYFTGGNAFFCK